MAYRLVQYASRARGSSVWNVEPNADTVMHRIEWNALREVAHKTRGWQEIGFVHNGRIYSITRRAFV